MRRLAALALLVALALPAGAQIVPDEFPGSEPMIDRAQRDLVERHRPFLSGLFASSTVAVGPAVGQPELNAAVAFEGGYRFGSGHAIALASAVTSSLDRPLGADGVDPHTTATVGGEVIVALGRGADRRSVLRGAEVGLGLGASFYQTDRGLRGTESVAVPSLSLRPRVALPLTPTMSVPVGLWVTQELGRDGRPGPFVGLSVGLRRIWADEARMVLE
ncbi:hypothetical protein [Rubrivirga sp.]|uniref:hypothetical protein n=1 Tax=Rubrivirga sp. TaxID=1885344 RepID=UPI003B52ED2F